MADLSTILQMSAAQVGPKFAECKAADDALQNSIDVEEAARTDADRNRVQWFASRALAVAAATGETWQAGAVIIVSDCAWQYDGSSTVLPDMPGWLPIGELTPDHFGIVPGIDQTALITAMLDHATEHGIPVLWGDGIYMFEEYSYSGANPRPVWRSRNGNTTLRSTKGSADQSSYEADNFVKISATTLASGYLSADVEAGESRITLNSAAVALAVPSDSLLQIMSDRVIGTDDRGQARVGWSAPVSAIIDETVIELGRPAPETVRATALITNASITAVTPSSWKITVAALAGTNVSEARYKITFVTVGGSTSSLSAYPSEFDPTTGTFTLTSSGYPTGLTVGDTISISRRVSFFLTNSVKADIQGIKFDRASPVYDVTDESYSFRCLTIARGLRPKLRDIAIANFPEAGVRLDTSYAGLLKNIDVYNANRAFGVTDGTGYGVSIFQSSWGHYKNIRGFGCRRTLDLGGTQAVSWDNEVENVSGYGGGTAIDGIRFAPGGATVQSVVGSHGGAYGTVYRNTRGIDVNDIVNLRGRSEVVRGVYGSGYMFSMINSFLGDGIDADGLYYTDQRPDWASNPNLTSKETKHGKLTVVATIWGSIQPGRPHRISNVIVRGIKLAGISLQDAPTIGSLILGGVQEYVIDNEDHDQGAFSLVRATGNGTPTINGMVDLGRPNIKNKPSAPVSTITIMNLNSFNIADGIPVKWPDGSIRFYLSDDSVASFPVQKTGAGILDFWCPVANRPQMCRDIYLTTNGRPYTYTGAANGMSFLAAKPTGTSGADGNVNVAYTPGDGAGALWIENRRGSRDQFALMFSDLIM